jgi:hypothetical protein
MIRSKGQVDTFLGGVGRLVRKSDVDLVIWSTRKLWCTNRWALADAMISTGGRVTDRSASKAK